MAEYHLERSSHAWLIRDSLGATRGQQPTFDQAILLQSILAHMDTARESIFSSKPRS